MNKILFCSLFLMMSIFSFSQTRVEAESYSSMSGVSVEDGWGDGSARDVYSINQGDWMEYSIHPTITGLHTFILRVGTTSTGAQLKIKKSDGTVLTTVDLPNTGDYQLFQSVPVTLSLTAGDQTIRIESSAAPYWTFNWFEYSFGYKLEAELYTAMSGVQTENTGDVGGGLNVGYIADDDWMEYGVNIQSAGTYSLKIRLASPLSGKVLQVKNSGGTVLMNVPVPNTGGYQNWQTVDTTITLSAGQQTLRIYALLGDWNINWWALIPSVTNASPVVNAGIDTTITLPANTATLHGSASDPDGSISSYAWTKVSGPSGSSFGSPTAATTTVVGLTQGVYVFRLTATDNGGAPAMDEISVTVNAASSTTQWLTTGNSAIDTTTQFIGTNDASPIIFKTNGQKRARITTDGVFMATKIRVTQSTWADYVFDSSYRLKPLSEVEQFINNHKHLPDVPSQKEVTGSGVDVGDNQAILLQKIEELTLYMIQLNKKLEKLEQENAALKSQQQQTKK